MNTNTLIKSVKYCGIDICGNSLDIYCDGISNCYPFSKAGVKRIISNFADRSSSLILVYESTGYLSRRVQRWAKELEMDQVCVNPSRIRNFARSKGVLAKTDKNDAYCIAEYAKTMNLKAKTAPSDALAELQELFSHQEFLIRQLSKFKVKLHACNSESIKSSLYTMIETTEAEIATIEEKMLVVLKTDDELQKRYNIYKEISGIGPRVAMGLVVMMPELGSLNRKEAASLVGVAPFNRESGEIRWKRNIYAGRGRMRRLLYLCCICAVRHNDVIKGFYKSLLARGKAKKLALIACVRKMIIHVNAQIKRAIA